MLTPGQRLIWSFGSMTDGIAYTINIILFFSSKIISF